MLKIQLRKYGIIFLLFVILLFCVTLLLYKKFFITPLSVNSAMQKLMIDCLPVTEVVFFADSSIPYLSLFKKIDKKIFYDEVLKQYVSPSGDKLSTINFIFKEIGQGSGVVSYCYVVSSSKLNGTGKMAYINNENDLKIVNVNLE